METFLAVDPLAEIARCEEQIAMLHGRQIRAMARFVAAAVTDPDYDEPEHAEASAFAEIALVLGVSPRTSDGRVGEARDLVQRLPATVAALCAGCITLSRARVILAETVNLPVERLAAVEAAVLPKAGQLTPGNLRRATRRVVERIDAEALTKRVAAARADRWVSLRPEFDGTAIVAARLPVEQAYAVYGAIDTLAHADRLPGEKRTIDQLRADVLVDLICNPSGRRSRVRYDVRVLVPANLLLGTGKNAGRMADGSAIPEAVTQAIAADSRWRRVLTDPASGCTLDTGAGRYVPSKALTDFIRTRDQHCRWPGCRQPAHRSELDHSIAFAAGGRTVRVNIAALCKRHHRVKHLPGWTCEQHRDGALTFTSPHGQVHRTRPPTADALEQPVEMIRTGDIGDPPPF
jgi:hypothetical protein